MKGKVKVQGLAEVKGVSGLCCPAGQARKGLMGREVFISASCISAARLKGLVSDILFSFGAESSEWLNSGSLQELLG